MHDIYTDHGLVALYDALNPAGADTAFYLRHAGPPSRIVDIGCGTGLLSRLLARQGHRVTGVEPAAAMLEVARQNDPEKTVTWIDADARCLGIEARFDLAIMTGHVFQVFSAADALSVLRGAFTHLVAGGRLVFDSRNPLRKGWERWTPALSARAVSVSGVGAVTIHHHLLSVDEPWVVFESVHHFQQTGTTKISRSRLRFPPKEEIETMLRLVGFTELEFCGSFDGRAYTQDSDEIIVTAHKA